MALINQKCISVISSLLMIAAVWAFPVPALSADRQTLTAGVDASENIEVSAFGGPSSVPGTLIEDSESKGAVSGRFDFVEDYLNFKKRVDDQYGLLFGFDYNALYQAATKSLNEDHAAGGVFRIFGQWTLIGRGSENKGTLIYKVENRHCLGTDIPSQDLGFETGYAGLVAVPFSDIGWALTNLYWDHHFLENRVALIAGLVDSTDYVDVYGLVNPWTDFSNLAFSTDPTIPAPNQGLGAAARVMATESVYVIGGVADANGDPTDPGNAFDSFFNDAEFFTHLEVGWVASLERGLSDNIHLTVWHADSREQARTSDGWGAAFSFSRLLADKWVPFLRAGFADDGGALWERSVSAGFGYYTRKNNDLIGLGLNWSRPAADTLGSGLDDQYTAEIYYRIQVLKVLTITPDVQLLFNPALNPDEDLIWVLGFRTRLAF